MSNCNKHCGVMRSPAGKPHVLRPVEGTPAAYALAKGWSRSLNTVLKPRSGLAFITEVRVFGFQLLREVRSRTAHPP